MKWRNLISYRDRLYTSNANIDVFELWTIWFVITKWKLEMGMSADCGDHVQICAIIALYIYIYFPLDRWWTRLFPFLFIVSFSLLHRELENTSLRTDYSLSFLYIFHYVVHRSYSRMRVFGQITLIVSSHFSFHLTSYSIILTRFVVPIQIHSFKIRAKVGSTWYGRYQSTFLHDFYRVKCVPHRGEYLAIMFHSISMKEDLKKKNTLRALFLAWC